MFGVAFDLFIKDALFVFHGLAGGIAFFKDSMGKEAMVCLCMNEYENRRFKLLHFHQTK